MATKAESSLEWKMVDSLVPVDLSNIADRGMKGVALLAVALGWNLVQRKGQPIKLVSRTGLERTVLSDTGVRQSVFWSLIASVLSHSDGNLPTAELIQLIVKQSGMSKAHAQVLTSRVNILAHNGKLHEIEEEEAITVEEPVVEEPEPPSAIALEPFTPTVRTEPTLSMRGANGEQYISPIMDTVIRQLIPDGDDQITYRCKICGLEFESKRGVGSHYGRHVALGEAEATTSTPKTVVHKVEGYKPSEVHMPRGDAFKEMRRLRKIVDDVQRAVGQEAIRDAERQIMVWQRKCEAAEKERDEAIARADRLTQNLQALSDLIKGVNNE